MAMAIRCDRCGAYFRNVTYTHLSADIYYMNEFNKRGKAERADLCPDCANELYKWLNNGFEEGGDEN